MRRSFPILPHRPGFTLIEAALATVIVGVGIVAMMQLFAACTQNNAYASRQTAGMLLANNIEEAMAALPFDDPIGGDANFGPETGETSATWNDVDDFDGATFSPPIDSMRKPLSGMAQYTQSVSVTPVNPNDLTATVSGYSGALRVTVTVSYRRDAKSPAQKVYQLSWTCYDG